MEINSFEYYCERAKLFLSYLDENNIVTILSYRSEAWVDLNVRINSGSKRRIKNLNDIIDNLIIGNNPLSFDQRFAILEMFQTNLNERKDALIKKKVDLFKKIVSNGIITSNIVINDAIVIQNSFFLPICESDKNVLKEIIHKSMLNRLDDFRAKHGLER